MTNPPIDPTARPVTEDELNDALRETGSDLDRLSSAHRVRLAGVEFRRPRRRGRMIVLSLLSVGAVATAVIGIASRIGSDAVEPQPDGAADAVDVPIPSKEFSAAERSAMFDACVTAMEDFVDGVPPEIFDDWVWEPPALSIAAKAIVPHPDDVDAVEVILMEGASGYRCTATSGIVAPAPTGQLVFNEATPPRRGGIAVRDTSWFSRTDTGDTGPGEVTIVGQVGEDVESVVLFLADGTPYRGSIADGWFFARSNIGDGVPLGDDVVEWTVKDGTTRRAPVDFLNGLDEAEACALDDACYSERTAELGAELAGSPGLIDEGIIDEDAVAAEREAWATCARTQGYDVRVVDDRIQYTSPPTDDRVVRSVFPTEDLLAACDRSGLDAVRELQRLHELRAALERTDPSTMSTDELQQMIADDVQMIADSVPAADR